MVRFGRRVGPEPGQGDANLQASVYKAYGKTLHYSRKSLWLFDERSALRTACVRTVTHPWFDSLSLFVILLNSVVLAMTDWSHIDMDPASPDRGQPLTQGSWRNTLLSESESIFTAFFVLEALLKIVAQGFYLGRGTYLKVNSKQRFL
jgi:Ion transport protein